jgi:hypothetical protein
LSVECVFRDKMSTTRKAKILFKPDMNNLQTTGWYFKSVIFDIQLLHLFLKVVNTHYSNLITQTCF